MPVTIVPRLEWCPHEERYCVPVLFLPDEPVSGPFFIVTYAELGQHSEAHINYFKETRPLLKGDEADALIKEWSNLDPFNRPTPYVIRKTLPKRIRGYDKP